MADDKIENIDHVLQQTPPSSLARWYYRCHKNI